MALNPQSLSPLFTIPPETRLHIYSYLIPNNTLPIDLCTTLRRSPPSPPTLYAPRPSPLTTFCLQLDTLNEITRINGLHLLLVCRRTQAEVLCLFARTTVHFHCPECFRTFLPNVGRGLGVGVEWMKKVTIAVNLSSTASRQLGPRQRHWGLTHQLAKTMAREVMQSCQKLVWAWYGQLNLMEKEQWGFKPLVEGEGREGDASSSAATGGASSSAVAATAPITAVPQFNLGAHAMALHGPQGMHGMYDAQPGVPTKWVIHGIFNI